MLTVRCLARKIFAGKNGEEIVIVQVFRNVANEQWKVWTKIHVKPISQITAALKYHILSLHVHKIVDELLKQQINRWRGKLTQHVLKENN